MTPFSTILTHPGGAHKDEFLACSVLLAVHPTPILRREPSPADLADTTMAVVDVGLSHDPALNNFDHHQLPRDYVPTCALSLVLRHLGLYEDTRAFCEWLEPAEWFDCRGPMDTARWLGVDRDIVGKLNSPIDGTLLRRFAQATRLAHGDPLWEIMRMIGEDLLGYVRSVRERLDFIGTHAEIWTLETVSGAPSVLFLPRTEPLPGDPSAGVERYVESQGLGNRVLALISPDRRSGGYGLTRHRDNQRLDFTRIAGEADVHFAHARGFVAKTSATDPQRLRELVGLAFG
ncbi:MAG: MYG1 family protein [Opitutus sp.]|nr:MYG1 family protein [Opitutus sp.]MCS6247435.1 MYG1 family protein [Opitutus sp.]MCS6273042.1 MYG1 family protein [Opitutus sp.]MCS6276730.1 MYG1 family protein [Opitutus sp.]MCS6301621.1 MYG1 family protein [Opitutus sp.]